MDRTLPNRPRLLVIDDDPALCQILAEVLDSVGYVVVGQGEAADFHLVLSAQPVANCAVPQVRLTRPLRMAQLLAAIDRALEPVAALPRIGRWRFDPVGRWLEDGDDRQRLTDKEAAILALLVEATGAVGRDELLNSVWGYGGDIDTHTLETHIYRLRQKVEDDPAQAVLLLTETGGYRLNRES